MEIPPPFFRNKKYQYQGINISYINIPFSPLENISLCRLQYPFVIFKIFSYENAVDISSYENTSSVLFCIFSQTDFTKVSANIPPAANLDLTISFVRSTLYLMNEMFS